MIWLHGKDVKNSYVCLHGGSCLKIPLSEKDESNAILPTSRTAKAH